MNRRLITHSFLAVSCLMLLATSPDALAQNQDAPNLEGTFWVGADSDGSPFVFEFQKAGKFRYIPGTGVISKGSWKQVGDSVEMEINGRFVKFSGAVVNEQLSGEARSRKGLKWKWTASKQPPVISSTAPQYPPIAKAARSAGNVVVEVEINAAGGVVAARLVSGHPLLTQVSVNAARLWKFAPSSEGGKVRTARLIFSFRGPVADRDQERPVEPNFLSPYQAEIRYIPLVIDFTTHTAGNSR